MGKHISHTRAMRWKRYYVYLQPGRTLFLDKLRQASTYLRQASASCNLSAKIYHRRLYKS